MQSARTHYPQVPVEIAQKIAEEQNGTLPEQETPEQASGPTAKEPTANSSAQAQAQAQAEGEKGEVL